MYKRFARWADRGIRQQLHQRLAGGPDLEYRIIDSAVVMAYARHWQVEMCYRACKSDLAMESPRLWFWENRLKLLLMVSLVYAFLLSLLAPHLAPLVQKLLRNWCHRTGERHRQAAIPLSRLRSALSTLWLSHPPVLNSG